MPLTKEKKKELEAKMQEFVGKPIGPPDVSRDAVNEPMIRQWCDAMGDTNPVYLDADVAASTVHGGNGSSGAAGAKIPTSRSATAF